jgi:hypothetical protein
VGIELGEGGWWGLGELLRVVAGTLDSLFRQTVRPHKGKKIVSHFQKRKVLSPLLSNKNLGYGDDVQCK